LWIALIPLCLIGLVTVADGLTELDFASLPAETERGALLWHRVILWLWAPIHLTLIFGLAALPEAAPHLSVAERWGLTFAFGGILGTVSISFAHELIHQRNRAEKTLGTWLFITMLNGQHATSHLAVHHRHVGTPKDPSTAPLGQGFWRFLPRLLWRARQGALRVEAERLRARGRSAWHISNPCWRYAGGALACLGLAWALGGWAGLAQYAVAAAMATMLLALADYIQHYGLTRRQREDGSWEPVGPQHSWNAAHRVSGWLMALAPRHSDHHMSGERPYPLLRAHRGATAPQLPLNFLLMTALALSPTLWRRVMDRRVARWRARFYGGAT
ncbi:MAG: alkane 1-monooxygenase, partial [Pseudomonadota bacterium]